MSIERLIEFLFRNIYFVVIIGGVLYTLLTRVRAKMGQPDKSPRMPTFGGGPGDREPGSWMPGQKPSVSTGEAPRTSTISQAKAPQGPSASEQRALLYGESVPDRTSLSSSSTPTSETEAASMASRQRHESSDGNWAGMGDADDLRRGVVWAEILGPPRAKKPYSYRK
ncbi:hypothetical protein [Paenibacillus koleovorans]|uniref:hypothetical protein n=1 Tax=Paenibacillus koleovorans TaxID=121608 RepID=UPI000FD7616E|nr:hypothetical protein [Paenibacillus koleovorans]